MANILGADYDISAQPLLLPATLQALLDSGFREEQNCILFNDFVYFGPGELTTDYDKTSYEDFLNYIDLKAYVTATKSDLDKLKVGIEFSKRLHQKLTEIYKNKFRIIISYDTASTEEQNIDSNAECIIKFHTIRLPSDDKFKVDNIDLATDQALMILE